MTWILTTVLCIILIEYVIKIPLRVLLIDISKVGRKSMHILGAKFISDHWKEKVMLAYARKLFLSTLKLAGYFIVFIAIAVLVIATFDYLGANIGNFLFTWTGIIFSFVIATIYMMARKRFV